MSHSNTSKEAALFHAQGWVSRISHPVKIVIDPKEGVCFKSVAVECKLIEQQLENEEGIPSSDVLPVGNLTLVRARRVSVRRREV